MCDHSTSTKGLPYKLSEDSGVKTVIPNHLVLARNNCIKALNGSSSKVDSISCIDIWLTYANGLLSYRYETGNADPLVEEEISMVLINVATFYEDIGIETLHRAYESSQPSNNLWVTSGTYLKRGLGLVGFLRAISQTNTVTDPKNMRVLNISNQLSLEFQLLQQLGIVILALSKLRSKVSKDAIVDLEPHELKELGTFSVFYAKLALYRVL